MAEDQGGCLFVPGLDRASVLKKAIGHRFALLSGESKYRRCGDGPMPLSSIPTPNSRL